MIRVEWSVRRWDWMGGPFRFDGREPLVGPEADCVVLGPGDWEVGTALSLEDAASALARGPLAKFLLVQDCVITDQMARASCGGFETSRRSFSARTIQKMFESRSTTCRW